MSTFLIKLTPLEPYFFGSERTFNFGDTKQFSKVKYFISSNEIPSQTTLLGMLRKIIIEVENLFNSEFNYNEDQKIKIDELIGKNSFNLDDLNLDFGIIKNIYPLFIIDEYQNYYIKTPFDHKDGYNYNAHNDFLKIQTTHGEKKIPKDFKVKVGISDGYLCLKDKRIRTDLFNSCVRVGINKGKTLENQNKEHAFYKKEYKTLKEKFSFAFFADLGDYNNLPESYLATLGQGKSLFEVNIQKKSNDLIEIIKDTLSVGKPRKYVLSPCLFKDSYEFEGAILKTKEFRYITLTKEKNYFGKFKKSPELFNLVTAGSIIYSGNEVDNKLSYKEHFEKIGMNTILDIGGN